MPPRSGPQLLRAAPNWVVFFLFCWCPCECTRALFCSTLPLSKVQRALPGALLPIADQVRGWLVASWCGANLRSECSQQGCSRLVCVERRAQGPRILGARPACFGLGWVCGLGLAPSARLCHLPGVRRWTLVACSCESAADVDWLGATC